jgi:ABC-type transport system substrate-binding protein
MTIDRYAKIGLYRSTLGNVDRWDAPDRDTFVITLKKAQPTFLEILSAFSAPIVIVPAEDKDDPPMQLKTIGTGPWQLVESVPGGYVKMKRYDGYKPNTNFEQKTGFGGYKQACFDTVTFRIVTEPQARVAGLKTGELQGVEDLPTKSLADLKADKKITIIPLQNWWIQMAQLNVSVPPTDNLMFRKAVQAALDMDEIMDAASDGNYRLNVGFQYPGQAFYSEAGKETYNIKNQELAKKYLAQSGYKGEPVILLTDKDYPAMYNSSLVMQQQMQAIGINAQLKVVDWPTSANMALKPDTGWNLFSFKGNPVANFGVRVFAFPDPPILITSSNRLADGSYELQLSGPIGQAIIIEGSTNQVDWTSLATNTFTNSVMTFVDSQGGSFAERFYRAIVKPDSLNLQSVKQLLGGAFQLAIAGSPGRKFVLETSSDLVVWTPISTNTVPFVGNPVTFVDSQATNFKNRFYRAQFAP